MTDVRVEPVRSLVDAVARPGAAEPFGAYCFAPADPGADLARHVEREVFLASFGNSPELLASEYGPYEQRSVFVVVLDHLRRVPAGMMRLIVPDETRSRRGLKSLDDLSGIWGIDSPGLRGAGRDTWDIATLAVDPAYRSAAATGLVSLGLYQSVVRVGLDAGARSFVAILDEVVYRMTRTRFAEPFDPIADGRPYLGSVASRPVRCDLAAWRARLAAREPHLERVIYDGVGIEPALAPLHLDVARTVLAELG